MKSDYKIIQISRKRKNEENASYIIENINTHKYDQIKVPQNEKIYEKNDYVDTKHIDVLNNEKIYKDYQKINCRNKKVYKDNLIEIADFLITSKNDPDFLRKKLLWNKIEKESQTPNHKTCAGKTTDDEKEKTICRCMYHYNLDNSFCNTCKLKPKWHNDNPEIKIIEYEYPTDKHYKCVGGVDLVIEYKNKVYATEVKPETSKETLARMFSEILTYTQDIEQLKREKNISVIYPAICFFENSKQHQDFKKYSDELPDIIKTIRQSISVFIITTKKNKNTIDFFIQPYNQYVIRLSKSEK